jgi:hypothetical protein
MTRALHQLMPEEDVIFWQQRSDLRRHERKRTQQQKAHETKALERQKMEVTMEAICQQ